MNKKIIVISLVLVAASFLAGCGARQSSNNPADSNQSSGQQEIDQTLSSLDQEMDSIDTSLDGSDLE